MNSLPEENKNLLSEESEEESTIFGVSPSKTEKKAVKKPKMLKTALSMLLALAVLAGATLAVIKLIPEKDSDIGVSSGDTVAITSFENEEVETVKVVRKDSSTVYRTTVTQPDEDNSDTAADVTWSIDGIDPSLTASASISLLMDTVLRMDAVREIEKEDGADYGFAAPSYTVEIAGYDAENSAEMIVGAKTPSDSGYYITVDSGETVYLANTADIAELDTPDEEMAVSTVVVAASKDTANADYFTEGALSSFDSITLAKKGEQTLKFEPNKNEKLNSYIPYFMTAPASRAASETEVKTLFDIAASGLSAASAYKFYPTAADKATYGLASPEVSLSIKYGTKTVTVNATKQDDGNFAVMTADNSDIIFKVASTSLAFADYSAEKFLNPLIYCVSITDIGKITYTTADGSTVFGVTYEEADEDADKEEVFEISANGTPVDADNFKLYYQYLVGMTPNEYTFEKQSGTPVLTVKAEYADGSGTDVIKFIKYSDRRYYVECNSTPLGFINTTHMEKLLEYLPKAANGEAVPDMY